ncbi:S8 family peptidase [Streptomyces sp. NPDC050504]|uniref:S8 family peptidase n=1 Tax=Streptomyces sp. NPDC050504 TaxID=3365618 RepID=UPI0037BA3BA1
MRTSRRRAGALALATAVAALATGLVAPAGATPSGPDDIGPGRSAASFDGAAPLKDVTLITGDRVVLDGKGKPVRVVPGKGREHIPVRIRNLGDRTLVVPADAERLIAAGKVDRRLFDLTELTRPGTVAAQRGGVKVIVQYAGTAAASARSEVRGAGAGTVRRTFRAMNAEVVQASRADAGALWSALTDSGRAAAADANAVTTTTATAPGIGRVWLDGGRRASLDKSVSQIGAPKAWAGGYDGKGVKIAVLDTGVDSAHPDLKGQVVAEQNFSSAADAKDRNGHGTHVASTAAGTGAKSQGAYKGVAPGARLLNGKVLDDFGQGSDSEILAGIEWAVAQGADIVNMSLGGPDSPELDPLEAAVNKLTAEKGVLFAVAAGNSGPRPSTVESPGSADAALTVGAVDDADALANFSSRGPRVGDGGFKPDVTAPGVEITAAAAAGSMLAEKLGQNPDGYLTLDGTSMATPHVAGAAAILKQRHPQWTPAEIKGALTGSAKQGAYSPFQGGTGRIQVDAALEQTVFAEPSGVSFGVAQWPHADDPVQTKKASFRNSGDQPVTLALTLDARDPQGRPAPEGFFALGATTVTVPARGTASVDVTVDTRIGGAVDGQYSAQLLAAGNGQSVRVPVVVDREVESYEVTFEHLNADGKPAAAFYTSLLDLSGDTIKDAASFSQESGPARARLAKGSYYLDSNIGGEAEQGGWLVQPRLEVTGPRTVTLDARLAKPTDITVPDRDAKLESAYMSFDYTPGKTGVSAFMPIGDFASVRTAHLGPAVTAGLSQLWSASWSNGTKDYHVTLGGFADRFATGYTRHLTAADLATVRVGLGASVPGKTGNLFPTGTLPGVPEPFASLPRPSHQLPAERTLHLSTVDKVRWTTGFQQSGESGGGRTTDAAFPPAEPKEYQAGKTYREVFNTAVFGPRIDSRYGLFRTGDRISGDVPLLSDGFGHAGRSLLKSAKTTLYRDGVLIGENDDPLYGAPFTVPAGDAKYRLSTSITRDPAAAATSTRIDASWEFRSKETAAGTRLPASTVRFGADVALDGTAPAGRTQLVPLTVQGAAANGNLKSLAVYASYDEGRTWKALTVALGKAVVTNPDKGKGVSLRALVVDKQGNRSTLDVHNAYYGK